MMAGARTGARLGGMPLPGESAWDIFIPLLLREVRPKLLLRPEEEPRVRNMRASSKIGCSSLIITSKSGLWIAVDQSEVDQKRPGSKPRYNHNSP